VNEAVYIGLGSNLGDKERNLRESLRRMRPFARVRVVSSLYRTEPVGFIEQDWFLNAAACIQTALEPAALLDALLAVEQTMGRVRGVRNGPRLIDLDLLFWGNQILDLPGLCVPHPRISERQFVLLPLAEIAEELVHPKLQMSVAAMSRALGAPLGVARWYSDQWPPHATIPAMPVA